METWIIRPVGWAGIIALGVAVFISKLYTLYRIRRGKRPYLIGLLPASPIFVFAFSCLAFVYAAKKNLPYAGAFLWFGVITSPALIIVLVRLWVEGLMARASSGEDQTL